MQFIQTEFCPATLGIFTMLRSYPTLPRLGSCGEPTVTTANVSPLRSSAAAPAQTELASSPAAHDSVSLHVVLSRNFVFAVSMRLARREGVDTEHINVPRRAAGKSI